MRSGFPWSSSSFNCVKVLEKLTQLTSLFLDTFPPVLTKAQIAELQKALPKCKISIILTK